MNCKILMFLELNKCPPEDEYFYNVINLFLFVIFIWGEWSENNLQELVLSFPSVGPGESLYMT